MPGISDNCPRRGNAARGNADADALGDACDPDQAPDLTAISNDPRMVFLGSQIPLNASVSNGGEGDAASSQVRFYLSMDQAFDPESDVAIGDCFAPALIGAETDVCDDPEGWIPMDLTIFGEGETAAYHWITCSDALDLIFESDESSNCSVDPALVLVPESDSSVLAATALMTLLGVVSTRRRASS